VKGIARGNRRNEVFALLLFGAATLAASCRGRGGDDLSARSSGALTSSDLLVTTIGHRTDGVISDRAMATTTVTAVGQTYTLTPAGHITQESRADGTVRYNRADTLGRLQCVVIDSATACPTTATTPLPATVSGVALYNGDKISNIRRRLAGGIANTRLEYDSATRNRPDRLVVSQGDCSTSSCETSFALAYDVWGSRSTETPSSGQGAGSVSRRFTYGPDKRLRSVRVASPQAPDSGCNPTRWDQVDTDIGYGEQAVVAFRKKHIGTSILQTMRYLRRPGGAVSYTMESAGPTASVRVTFKYLPFEGHRVVAVREAWSGSVRTSRKYIFLHSDQNGAPMAGFITDHLDTAGTQQWLANRDPWGWTNINGDLSTEEIPFEFPGQIRLDGTEVTRLVSGAGSCQVQIIQPAIASNGFRDYDPGAGIYLSRDPIALLGSEWSVTSANRNLYAYAGFAPIESTDVWGLQTPGAVDNALIFVPVVGPADELRNATLRGEFVPALVNAAFLFGDLVTVGELSIARSAAVGTARAAITGEVRAVEAVAEVGGAEVRQGATACSSSAAVADEAFHYTSSKAVSSIESQGLRPGTYATPNGTLSPLQAQIDLALRPNRGVPDALVRIDLDGMRQAGYSIPEATQVARNFGMPGGDFEMLFTYSIPPEFLTVVRP